MKRYAEYKESDIPWMREVPSHWNIDRAKWHFTQRIERGNVVPQLLAATQKYGMYPQEKIEGVVKVAEGTDIRTFKTVHKNDFVISLRSFQGGFERSDYEGVCSPAYQVFYADAVWNTEYLKYLFKNELFIDAMNALTVGIREGRNIKYEDFANSYIAIPPISEQVAIAEYLNEEVSHMDALIAEAKTSIEEYKTWKASIVYEAVTKGLDKDAEMKDSGFEWIGYMPAHWRLIQNKHVMRKQKRICDTYKGQDIISLTMNGVIIRDLGAGGKMPTTFDGYQYVYPGELLMCLFDIDVTPRCVGRVYNEGLTSPAYSCFVLNEGMNLDYYYYYYLMMDNTKELLHLAKNLRHSLTEEQLGQIKVPVPPMEEQIEIGKVLDEKTKMIDSLISEKESLITDLEAFKKSLIFEVVTGKRKVV